MGPAWMEVMAGVRDHTELDAWKLSDAVQKEVERITSSPSFNRYPRLKDQMQRASESPCPNIAEGFSRYYPREIARFVRIATGSLSELLDHLKLATRRRLVSEEDARNLESLAKRARGASTKWVRYLEATPPSGPRPGDEARNLDPSNHAPEPRNRRTRTRNGAPRNPDRDRK